MHYKRAPAGIGEPCFDKLSANLAKAVCSIGAVKGFEIGDGFAAARSNGSVNNDAFHAEADGRISKLTNHAGGVLGGISDGSDVVFRAAFNPPLPSAQNSRPFPAPEKISRSPSATPRTPSSSPEAVVVVECMGCAHRTGSYDGGHDVPPGPYPHVLEKCTG